MTDLPELAPIAISGSYDDLSGKPSIPAKLSDLENDSAFITKNTSDLENYYIKSEVDTKIEELRLWMLAQMQQQ